MENVSVAKKATYHGRTSGFITAPTKSLYDDVFGAPPQPRFGGAPTLAPRYEDYSEIFGGFHSSRASSIPILDLPVLQNDDVSFDVRFDYSEVFGGFKNVVGGFGSVSYEDLVRQDTSGYVSSDEAWSPAQSETLSDESNPSAFSERSQSSSGADVHHSSDGTNQFNVSYHRASQRSDGIVSNGMTHVTHLHAIPGYTYRVSGSQASRSSEDEEPPREPTHDLNHGVDLSGTVLEGKRLKRSSSRNVSSSYIMHGSDSKLPERYSEAGVIPEKPFLTVSDISLRTRPSGLPPPSRPPPALAAKKGDFDRLDTRFKGSKSCAFERKQGHSSQPYFDVEEYASSSAAASTAAIKEAMEKAQAKLKSAKELMERKKQDLKFYAELHLENGILEERQNKTFDKDGMAHSMCAEEMDEVFKNTEVVSGNIEEKHSKFTRKFDESEQGKPYLSSQQLNIAEGRAAWREGAEFIEVVETYPSSRSPKEVQKEFGQERYMELHECSQSEAANGRLDRLETCKNIAAKEATHCKEESGKKVPEGFCQSGNKHQRSEGEDFCGQLEHKETVKAEGNFFDINMRETHVEVDQQERTCEKLSSSSHKSTYIREGGQTVTEHKATVKLTGAWGRLDDQKRLINADAKHIDIKLIAESDIEGCEGGIIDAVISTNGRRVNEIKQDREKQRDTDSESKEVSVHQEGHGKKSKEGFRSGKNAENSEAGCKEEKNERDNKLTCEMDSKDQDEKGAFEREKEARVAIKKKEHEGEPNDAGEREETEGKSAITCEGEENEGRPTGTCEGEDGYVDITEASEQQENKMEPPLPSKIEFENLPEEAFDLEENEQTVSCDGKWDELREQTEATSSIGMVGSSVEQNPNVKVCMDAAAFDLASRPNSEILFVNKMSKTVKGNLGKLEATQSSSSCEENVILETELQNSERESEVGMTNGQTNDESNSVCKSDTLERREDQIRRADASDPTSTNGNSTNSCGTGMCMGKASDRLQKTASDMGNHSAHENGNPPEFLMVDPEDIEPGTNQKITEEKFTANLFNYRTGTNPEEPRVNSKAAQSGANQEAVVEKFTDHNIAREWAANAKKIGDTLATVLEDVEILSSTDQRAASGGAQKKEQSTSKIVPPEVQKTDERLKKEIKLGEEYLRKLEEEREREREREKDRMSVTREALERSYLEVRERVERAAMERNNAEARQRAAEARERLEKASADARARSEQASVEARLRAERAAVERATAEARQRAFEKAKAEKATQESRERVERSSSDNFSAYSRSTEMRQSSSSEQYEHQSIETSKLRYSYSSAHAGIEGESPQRCKARLERYRRTSERAAKALAEKNMRDLLAQREQAERNRLAETLDAEVKRWSSGKEGNLRALLSTLQYILGPNSGWHPIPLTEVITSAAVKKAYRKATLCVHPDKLQQRGASIQQKYICEKVFDLLKEAWNKFNSEER